MGEGSEEAAPEKVVAANPADAAPMHARAPKPDAEAAARKAQYMTTGAEPGAMNSGAIAAKEAAAGAADVISSLASVVIDEKASVNEKGASVLFLITSMPSTTAIEGNQITLRNILSGKLKFKAVEVDG